MNSVVYDLIIPEVVGSNPAPATKNSVARKSYGFRAFCC